MQIPTETSHQPNPTIDETTGGWVRFYDDDLAARITTTASVQLRLMLSLMDTYDNKGVPDVFRW